MTKDITAIIKAFKRPEKMKKTIDYALASGIEKIHVGYDGTDEYYLFHKRIIDRYDKRVTFHRYKYDVGLSYVRNRLLEKVKTKYLFLMDDDQYIHPKSLNIVNFLNKHKNIDVVGFPAYFKKNIMFNNWCFNVDIKDHKIKTTTPELKIIKYNDIYVATGMDTIENCAIFRTNMLREMGGWDEHYIIEGEHMDFYLNRKFNYPHLKLASCINLFYIHDIGPGLFLYNDTRYGGDSAKKSREYFKKKWSVDKAYGFGRNLYKDIPELLKYKKIYLKNEMDFNNAFKGGNSI
jgi:hypothetical protein